MTKTPHDPTMPQGGVVPPGLRHWWAVLVSHSILRFILVGGSGFVLDIGLLAFFREVLDAPIWLAASGAFWITVVYNYTLHRLFTFKESAQPHSSLVRYGVILGVNYLITLLIVSGADSVGVNYLLAKVLVVGVLAITNYLAYRYWVFAPPRIP